MIVFTGRDKRRFNRFIPAPRQVHNHEKRHHSADEKDFSVKFMSRLRWHQCRCVGKILVSCGCGFGWFHNNS